jgi:hypothetical protein
MLSAVLGVASDGPGLRRVPYNASAPPVLTCSTKYGCEVILQPGERLRIASLFDSRWTAKVADDGSTGMAPRVLIGPTLATDDDGHGRHLPLRTSLDMLTTKREYVVRLVATSAYEEHRLGFTYRDDAPVVIHVEPPAMPESAPVPSPTPSEEMAALDPAQMDFGWRAQGEGERTCVGVFSVGSQVWCKLPEGVNDAPAAYQVDGRKLVPIASHEVGKRWVVIDVPTSPIALVWGGSHEQTVRIVRARE